MFNQLNNLMRIIAIVFAAGLLLSACSQFDVQSDYDPGQDFSAYRSFHLRRDAKVQGDRLKDNDFTQRRIFAAIEGNLASKGFHAMAEDSADLIVITYAGVQEKVNLATYGYSTSPYWHGYYGGYGGSYSTQTVVTKYDEGTLYIDIIDRHTKGLVWKGQGRGVIGETHSPQEREALINEAIGEVLNNFPPGSGY